MMLSSKLAGQRQLPALAAILALLGLMLLPGSQLAAQSGGDLYVAPNGSDANDCRTAATPCLTIGAALALAVAGDTVNVAAGTYVESLRITTAISIVGAGARSTILESSGGGAVLVGYNASTDVAISNVTVRAGNALGAGGGIANYSRLTLTDSIVEGNSTSPGEGYQGLGGGIANFGALTVVGSAIVGNRGSSGGGIWNGGTLAVSNSTISGNSALLSGGGVSVGAGTTRQGTATFNSVTVAENTADSDGDGSGDGGGVAIEDRNTAHVVNSLLAGNIGGGKQASDCAGTLQSRGHNLVQATDGCTIRGNTRGNILAKDPLLGPLQDNGGPTPTRALQAGSPALDAGDEQSCLPTDQRGVQRPQGTACDIGAYELEATFNCPCGLWDETVRPAIEVDPDRGPVELGVRFRAGVDGAALGIRYYKSKENVGTHVGSLWDSDGTLLASATFVCETEAGWQEARFAKPVKLRAGVVYTASYFAPYGSYSVTEDYWTEPVARGPLYAFADSEGGNGVYHYGASGFPTQTYRASNYWVDPIFEIDD